ncbi:MAG: pentapeptide repeat-containing protein [Bdellovibrionales bacterium]
MSDDDNDQELTTLTQEELDKVISRHESFKDGRSSGVRAILQHYNLTGLSFKNRNLSGADLTGSVLLDANFEHAELECTVFYACDLRNANFTESNLSRADLRGACMRGAIMAGANMEEADLREGSYAKYDPDKGLTFTSDSKVWKEGTGGADMRGANLASVKLAGTIAINSNFEDANLTKSTIVRGNLSGANLKGADLSHADLSQCELENVNLEGANLVGVKMDFSNLKDVNLEGVLTDRAMGETLDSQKVPLEELLEMHQVWIKTHGGQGAKLDLSRYDLRSGPSLVGANLTMLIAEHAIWYGRDLSRVSLQAALVRQGDFRQCIFRNADLRGSNFSKSNMVNAKFFNARLEPLMFEGGRSLKTSFKDANLRYANFSGADLRYVDFTGADLTAAILTDAHVKETIFDKAILTDAKMPQ